MRTRLFTATCLLVSTLLSGCALTVDKIDIQYSAQRGVQTMARAEQATVGVTVSDQRLDKSKVSSKKNGFGMEMAAIIASDDVSVIVRKSIETELLARGFKLGTNDATVHIAADLTRFYNDFKTGMFAGDAVADLNMTVTVKSKQGALLYSKQVMAQGKEENIQLASGDNAKLALERALQSGIRTLFEDRAFIAALLAASRNPSP